MSDQKIAQLFQMIGGISALLEQIMATLEVMDKRLSRIELKISMIEKCVSYENAEFEVDLAK